ncbi:hypothetical protein A2U01_0030705, partial [Trifolium medium]|nr:hypothetical protein [Trifolium medium]
AYWWLIEVDWYFGTVGSLDKREIRMQINWCTFHKVVLKQYLEVWTQHEREENEEAEKCMGEEDNNNWLLEAKTVKETSITIDMEEEESDGKMEEQVKTERNNIDSAMEESGITVRKKQSENRDEKMGCKTEENVD